MGTNTSERTIHVHHYFTGQAFRKGMNPLRNERGLLTADFLFAVVFAMAVSAILFTMTLSLSVIEIGQYITFASARAHSASHETVAFQQAAARAKYTELTTSKPLAVFFNNPEVFFEVSVPKEIEIRSGANTPGQAEFLEYGRTPERSFIAHTGVRMTMQAKILDFRIPMLGRTSEEGDNAFKTKITSLMMRESSAEECRKNFVARRYRAILSKSTRYGFHGNAGVTKYVPMEDNGC